MINFEEERKARERRRDKYVVAFAISVIVWAVFTIALCVVYLLKIEPEPQPTPAEQIAVQVIPSPTKEDDYLAGADTEAVLFAGSVSVGECKITHYCCEPYEHICGTGDGITATGVRVKEGVVAVDPKVIPLHADVYINGEWYVAEDIGHAIKGNRVDIAVPTHNEALKAGTFRTEVLYIARE